MVARTTHTRAFQRFLGTLFKEDPPLRFYIALKYSLLYVTPALSLGEGIAPALGEYYAASAVSVFLGCLAPWVQEAPSDWPASRLCAGHTSRPLGVQWCLQAHASVEGISGHEHQGRRWGWLPALLTRCWVEYVTCALSLLTARRGQCRSIPCPLSWLQNIWEAV